MGIDGSTCAGVAAATPHPERVAYAAACRSVAATFEGAENGRKIFVKRLLSGSSSSGSGAASSSATGSAVSGEEGGGTTLKAPTKINIQVHALSVDWEVAYPT